MTTEAEAPAEEQVDETADAVESESDVEEEITTTTEVVVDSTTGERVLYLGPIPDGLQRIKVSVSGPDGYCNASDFDWGGRRDRRIDHLVGQPCA